jgi:hypothetical protein
LDLGSAIERAIFDLGALGTFRGFPFAALDIGEVYGTFTTHRAFLLESRWVSNYPEVGLNVSMEMRHLICRVTAYFGSYIGLEYVAAICSPDVTYITLIESAANGP